MSQTMQDAKVYSLKDKLLAKEAEEKKELEEAVEAAKAAKEAVKVGESKPKNKKK